MGFKGTIGIVFASAVTFSGMYKCSHDQSNDPALTKFGRGVAQGTVEIVEGAYDAVKDPVRDLFYLLKL